MADVFTKTSCPENARDNHQSNSFNTTGWCTGCLDFRQQRTDEILRKQDKFLNIAAYQFLVRKLPLLG